MLRGSKVFVVEKTFRYVTSSNKVVFKTCSIRHIMEAQPHITQSAMLSPTNFGTLRCIWLPEYPEAKILLEKYIRDIDHIHHVVHTPSLPSILDEVYVLVATRLCKWLVLCIC